MPISNYAKAIKDKANGLFNDRFAKSEDNKSQVAPIVNTFFTANSNYTTNKSIQKNFKFIVQFDNNFQTELINNNIYLHPHHILSVDLPTSYGFKIDSMKIGPYSYSFPVMEHNGFDISIVFEEDEYGSIAKMIHYLQYKIIKDTTGNRDRGDLANGTYIPQTQNRIKDITINIYNDGGQPVRSVVYKDVFFQSATPTSLNYDGNESIKYTVVFHSDFMEQGFAL